MWERVKDNDEESGTHNGDSDNHDDALRRVGDRLGDSAGLLDGHRRQLVVAVEPKPCHAGQCEEDSLYPHAIVWLALVDEPLAPPACARAAGRLRAIWTRDAHQKR